MLKRIKQKLTPKPVPCKAVRTGNPSDGYDYECGYGSEIRCDDCICNFGYYDPRTGKRISRRKRRLQNKKALEHYYQKPKEINPWEENL